MSCLTGALCYIHKICKAFRPTDSRVFLFRRSFGFQRACPYIHKAGNLPKEPAVSKLSELRYNGKAINQNMGKGANVGLRGISKGAELALTAGSSWSFHGQEVPYIAYGLEKFLLGGAPGKASGRAVWPWQYKNA